MNLGDVKTRVKRQFGDEAQVQISDADIIRWANDGQRHVTMNNETINQKTGFADLVSGQQSYTLPTDLFVLASLSIKYTSENSYYHIEGMTVIEFNKYLNGWDGTGISGTNRPYVYHKYSNTVRLFPTPANNVVQGMKLDYARYPIDLANNADDIDLPFEYHSVIVDYCLQQAYELDEDWQASQAKAGQVASTIHKNRDRELWGNQEVYSLITILPEDM